MNDPLKNLFNNRSASNDFLLGKAEAVTAPDATCQEQPQLRTELTRDFPDLLAGQAFVDRALANLKTVDTFQAFMIRIDPPAEDGADPDGNPPVALQVEIAKSLDRFCENQGWQWGKLDREIFGCFLPLENGADHESQGPALKTALDELQPATFSIGCARFPLLDYHRENILDNARKALDHAAFF